jgi:arabinose-5-phosphate isomerase
VSDTSNPRATVPAAIAATPDAGHGDVLALAREVLETEARAIMGLIAQLDVRFANAVELLHSCAGRVVLSGMGKSGIIARKLAATLSSTGTAAYFLHPAEAIHGDLGVVRDDDVVIALSHSGETEELVRLVESIRRTGARLIANTGDDQSTLAQTADISLSCHVAEEACPMNLAPTASTTATLALGDALAMALSKRKGFRQEHFASLHPGGRLGKRLMRVEALLISGDAVPRVLPATPVADVIHEISTKRLGMTCVVDADGRLAGIVTDGDLRRHLTNGVNLLAERAADIMTDHPVTISSKMLAVEALQQMEHRKITSLVVVDAERRVTGVVHLHDLLRTRII